MMYYSRRRLSIRSNTTYSCLIAKIIVKMIILIMKLVKSMTMLLMMMMMMMIKSSNFKQKRKGQRFGCLIWLFFSKGWCNRQSSSQSLCKLISFQNRCSQTFLVQGALTTKSKEFGAQTSLQKNSTAELFVDRELGCRTP